MLSWSEVLGFNSSRHHHIGAGVVRTIGLECCIPVKTVFFLKYKSKDRNREMFFLLHDANIIATVLVLTVQSAPSFGNKIVI